jgi:hypothetical protein
MMAERTTSTGEPPWANAIAECRVGAARRECLDWMLITERHLQLVLSEYTDHCNSHGRTGRCGRTRLLGVHFHATK